MIMDIDFCCFMSLGMVMVILGIKETQHLSGYLSPSSHLPDLWWLGIMVSDVGRIDTGGNFWKGLPK